MKNQLSKSVADHIIAENQKLKLEIIYLKKDLKLFQDKMAEAMDKLASSLSTKDKDYKQLLLFNDPYQCLVAFVQNVTRSTDFSVKTSHENKILVKQNGHLTKQIKKIKDESLQRIKKEEEIIAKLNQQIEQKRKCLIQLEENYQELLKTKKLAEKQLNQIKEHMKILRLKLYEQQRQKLTQIIVANKKQMIQFRRSMEMQAYKQEMEFKRQVNEKDKEIKLLTKNIEDLANNNLTASSDLTVLEKIIKPLRESTQLKDEITDLKKQSSLSKQQIRQKYSIILGLEAKLAEMTLSRDNLKSHNERLDIQKRLLISTLDEKIEELEKSIKDKKAMDLYYNEKWHNEFSKVKQNLSIKYARKAKTLQLQFEAKKKQMQAEIEAYLQRIKILKAQLNVTLQKNEQHLQTIAAISEINVNLGLKIQDLSSILRESQNFHLEQSIQISLKWQNLKSSLEKNIMTNLSTIKKYQQQLKRLESQSNQKRVQIILEKNFEIQKIKQYNLERTQQVKQKYVKQMQQLQRQYSNQKQAIQTVRSSQRFLYEEKETEIFERHQQKLQQTQKIWEMKVQKVNQKSNLCEIKYQRLRKRRQDQSSEFNQKIAQLNKFLHQKGHQLVARDVEIEEYKNMKDTYMAEITKINRQLNETAFEKQSLQVQIQSVKKQLNSKQKQVAALQNQKYKFKQDLLQFQKKYKLQFQQLKRVNNSVVAQQKSKIWQLERLFEKRPIKKKDFEKIQSLQKQNFTLKTQMHIKQAENLILNEVKQYYELKSLKINQNQKDQKKLIASSSTLFGQGSNHDLMKQTMKQTMKYSRPLYMRKPTNRKNKLLTTSFKKIRFQEEQDGRQFESKELKDMKMYLSRQGKAQQNSILIRNRNRDQRVKSSMM